MDVSLGDMAYLEECIIWHLTQSLFSEQANNMLYDI